MSTPDPLTVLRADDQPITPDATFTEQLRHRLRRGVDLPEGVDMTVTLGPPAAPTPAVERPGALPYLAVVGADAAIDWYVEHLGARLRGTPITMPDGRVGHAELELGGGAVYLAEAFDEIGLAAPAPGAVSVSLMLAVDDADAAVAAAAAGGATVQREPYDAHGSRTGVVIDPFGHRWMLSAPPPTGASATEHVRPGDVVYLSLWCPDAGRAAAFYSSVLGWVVEDGQVTNLSHRLGISESPDRRTIFAVYAVDDRDDARRATIDAGGRVPQNTGARHGAVDLVDAQGVEFAVTVADPSERRGELHPSGHGELTYLTVHTPDSATYRDFYGQVLGWQFTPGRIDDGWEVDDSRPQIGIGGGADTSEAVAMWAVDDIEAAVERVVAAGGRVTDPVSRQPYATTAECVDDQGIRFWLAQY
ncbi:VOC family protein [uncultured Williamsia sp.]|uniref:VOC family protein n=1 Tax=uncultured Williamsia sp. TaxID=259311 RepID=UPI002601F854|nr:VOC family protein [uncultured Williamsia sp.]